MKILYNKTRSTQQLPKSQTILFDSTALPSKLNIKLKTHSLTCLDIPLETVSGFGYNIPLLQFNNKNTSLVGSVDLISDMQYPSYDEKLSHFSPEKPLLNLVSSTEQLPSIQQERQHSLKYNLRASNLFQSRSFLNEPIVELRQSKDFQNIYGSSSRIVRTTAKQRARSCQNNNGPIPRFTFRELPSYYGQSSDFNHGKLSSELGFSSQPSLPEFQLFLKQQCSDDPTITSENHKSSLLTKSLSWTKSDSWSWKSSDSLKINSSDSMTTHKNKANKQTQFKYDDLSHGHLPIIIESPSQKRFVPRGIHKSASNFVAKLTRMSKSNSSFHHNQILERSHQLFPRKDCLPHSISSYEMPPKQQFSHITNRYPSTPLLAYPKKQNVSTSVYCINQCDYTPLAVFDEDDDSTYSVSHNNSFQSCVDSVNEMTENDIIDISSSASSCISETYFERDILPYHQDHETMNPVVSKHNRLSVRHFCIIQ